MEKLTDIISDEALDNAWGNASFGDIPKRQIVANGLLKYACGYTTGHTIYCILLELKLITKNENLSTLGKRYLYEAMKNDVSV